LDQTNGSYKAMRIEPGVYTYDDGSSVDCALYDAVIRNVRGVNTFKMYYQTPGYELGSQPERGAVGSGDNIYFENISIDLDAPIDRFEEYMNSDPLRGSMAAFEIGANLGTVSFENIEITLHRDVFPLSYVVCVGPKSARLGEKEIFDPYISCAVKELRFRNITVNGEKVHDITPCVKEIVFDDINGDGHSTGAGRIERITLD